MDNKQGLSAEIIRLHSQTHQVEAALSVDFSPIQSNDFAGEVRPVLAEQRDRNLRNDSGDDGRHGGTGYIQCAHVFSLQGKLYLNSGPGLRSHQNCFLFSSDWF